MRNGGEASNNKILEKPVTLGGGEDEGGLKIAILGKGLLEALGEAQHGQNERYTILERFLRLQL